MPFAITGAKYASATVSAVGTTTVTVGTTPFVSGDFASPRLVGLWTSASVFKGMAWVRRYVSTSQIQLQTPFFDPATGEDVAQVIGDIVLVSKNFTESITAGLAVSGRAVTITDVCTFGVNGNQAGVCFYDENKFITATAGMILSGGLTVFGKLDDYASNGVSSSIDVQSNSTNPLLCNDAAVNFCGYGGRWESSASPAYFIGGNNQGTGGQTVVLNGVETPNDLLTSSAGGAWARNPTRHQLVNCYSVTTSNNAIMRRWGNGVIRGGQYRFPNNTSGPISAFGSDSVGTYTVAADPGARSVILDMGASAFTGTGKPALVRASGASVLTFNFTNLITTDFRSTQGASGGVNPNGTNTFSFSDTYSGLQSGTVGVILNNASAITDSIASSADSWSPSLLRRTCVGETVTVNATSWTYGFKRYGFQVVSGSIMPTTYDLGTAGAADNVMFGGAVNQLADANITLSQTAANALTEIATIDDLYDAAINWATLSVANAQYPSLSQYPVVGNGTTLDLGAINLIVDATAGSAFAVNMGTNTLTIKSVALVAGAKFNNLVTSGSITFANGADYIGSYTDASGTRVTIRTSDGLALSTELLIDGVPQGWQVGQVSRRIFVQPSSVVRIYAHAYGYQPKIINVTGNTASDYVVSLVPETLIDTGLSTSTRDMIVDTFSIGVDGLSRLYLSVSEDQSVYRPDEVLNALHYYIVTQGALVSLASLSANSVDGFALIQGGFVVRTPGFYGKVADSVTTTGPRGIYVPLFVDVDPSVYVAMPSYSPVEKNTSGIVLSTALWTQQTAIISALDKSDIRNGLATEDALSAKASQSSVDTIDALIQARLDVAVSTRLASSGYTAPANADIAAIKAKTDTLVNADTSALATSAQVAALGSPLQASSYVVPPTTADISTAVQAGILNELDGQAVVDAIVQAIGNENITATAIASAVRSEVQDELTKIDELHAIAGLDPASPMTVTKTSREAGSISLEITGDGVNTSTVTRT